MTNTEETCDIDVCVDCLFLLANGDVGDRGDLAELMALPWVHEEPEDAHLYNLPGDDGTDNPSTRHAAVIAALWGDDWYLVPGYSEEDEGGFSWRPCGGCGCTLGGDRHPAVAFRKVGADA